MNKKILVILNNINSINYEYLSKNYKNVKYIYSVCIMNKSFDKIKNMILKYDIVFIGGGPQHLTNDKIKSYHELNNLFNVVKICEENNILLIGICLGSQIIAHYYNSQVIKLSNVCIGTNYLDINNVNKKIISNDKYLSKLDLNILKKSFSFHHDGIKINKNNNLDFIAFSINNIPYIIKHKSKNIYGFQFHPEVTKNYIYNILNIYNIVIDMSFVSNISEDISRNFFDAFLT